MVLSDIGYGALVLTLCAAVWATLASLLGARRQSPELLASAKNALWVTAGLTTLSGALLLVLLFTHQFQVRYVYEHVSTYLGPAYVFAALWAGLEGSQLLWLWLLAVFTGLLLLRRPTWDRELRPYALAILALTQAFFALLLVVISNPFELLPTVPAEGISLNPLLQNFWMIVHPPIVFASYALWTIPAAYALAALVTGRLDASWVRGTRRWTLAAWATLGIGILVGGWWAYLELGWGGYWGWDPVENSSFIPWLVGTAFVHSAIIQERRDMFRTWSVALAVVTFLLTVFATFVTRSGLIQSVHAFAESPIGYYYLGFMLLLLAVMVGLILARRQELHGTGELGNLLTKEFAFLVGYILLLGLAVAVLLGTLWPTLMTALGRTTASLEPESYNKVAGPLGLLLVVLLGLCPLVEWRTTAIARLLRQVWIPAIVGLVVAVLLIVLGDWQWWAILSFAITAFVGVTVLTQMGSGVVARVRTAHESPLVAAARAIAMNRRRYGGQLVHLAILLIVMGITGSQAQKDETHITLAKGEQIDVGGYTLRYESSTYQQIEEQGNKATTQAVLEVSRGGSKPFTLRPERNLYTYAEGTVAEVGLRSTLKEDLYIVLSGMEPDGLAAFDVTITPLVIWLWIGGVVLILGTLIAVWPARKMSALVAQGQEGQS